MMIPDRKGNWKVIKKTTFELSVASIVLLGTAATAQEATSAGLQTRQVDEIVVTAQKRTERAQDVPISIAAFSAEKLEAANVDSIVDLPRITPGLSVTKGAQTASTRVSLRGLGSAGNTGMDPSVATFLDGIYVARHGAIIGSMLDIEGVEVLRGPQGTLFGRNASGGVISLRSALPNDQFGGSASVEGGTGDRYRGEGIVNFPLASGAAIRVAAMGETSDGLYRNRLDGNTYGAEDTFTSRVSGKFDLADNIHLILRGDYSRTSGDGFALLELIPSSVTPAQLTNLRNVLGSELPDLNPYDRVVNQFVDNDLNDRQWGLTSDLSIETTSGFNFRLINGYRDWKNSQEVADQTGFTRPLIGIDVNYRSKSHSHEFQILSPEDELLNGRLDFVLGLYYSEEDFYLNDNYSLLEAYCPVVIAIAVPQLLDACNSAPGHFATVEDFNQNAKSFAAFGQTTLAMTSKLDLTLGARWTRDRKQANLVQFVNNPAAAIFRSPENSDLSYRSNQPTWRANLAWKPSQDQMIFATFSTGYKAGGFNTGGGPVPLAQSRIFDAEKIKNYEMGAKTIWLNGLLRSNVTLFRMDISGFQDRGFDGFGFIVRNVGSVRNQGVELDGSLRPTQSLSFDYSALYLDSEFRSYEGAPGLPAAGGTQDLSGTRPTFSPKWSGSLAAQYENDLGNTGLRWALRGNMSFFSSTNIGLINDNNPQTIQKAYQVIGGRATISSGDDSWSLSLFGDNILNKGYCHQIAYQFFDRPLGMQNPTTGGTALKCLGMSPRTYGVSADVRF